ncbi:SMI1/KNR4 family protein [Streptomyces sp. NBC_01803]|uniref:SMI1/KNR4 family protein n=1 Tax=Streptomyces sp. NBC_01803 TaxID=2975946 RepID=UPI002DD83793|nr:SMI1/KNR4 family protein [Streptomyces sp. NBC_01803]WSA45383.1 SMI1/KNR4 family protein [Streptomyces sp. NBC_01803]
MNESIQRLTQLIQPPELSPPGRDWEEIFGELGTRLPVDYISFIDRYGGGQIDDYLWVLEPHCANRHYDLITHRSERAEAFEMLWNSGERKPDELSLPGADIVPWATTDNGEFLYWLIHPAAPPEDWTIMVNEARGDWWEHFPVGCVEFLASTLSGDVASEILDPEYFAGGHEFRPSSTF